MKDGATKGFEQAYNAQAAGGQHGAGDCGGFGYATGKRQAAT
jgi:hypothetical protein